MMISARLRYLRSFATTLLIVSCACTEDEPPRDTSLASDMTSRRGEQRADDGVLARADMPEPKEMLDAERAPDVADAQMSLGDDGGEQMDAGADLAEMGAMIDMPPDMASPCQGEACLFTLPGCRVEDVQRAPGNNWADSYSVDGECYCDTTFDHNIGGVMVDTPAGRRTVREVCEALGPGPGKPGHPVYNDVQCGNGPPNDAGDEDWCPGRVDQGEQGCCTAGPRWNLGRVDWGG